MPVQVRPWAPSAGSYRVVGRSDLSKNALARRAAPCAATMPGMTAPEPEVQLLDRERTDEIRKIERATGRTDVLSGLVQILERNLAGFGAAFADLVTKGDAAGAKRAAHTLKGTCHQLGAKALGDLFAEIERNAAAGDYAEAKRKFEGGASLVAQSIEALKHA
jgi:HPt (histidine-containing phosphotransfer) domain-containing protein